MEPPDVSEQFQRQVKAVRPLTITATTVGLSMLGGGLAVLLVDRYAHLLTYILGIGALLLAVLAVPIVRAHRCPSCGKLMGRDVGIFCPLCGARLSSTLRKPPSL
jgi:uncharacterized membrane protein